MLFATALLHGFPAQARAEREQIMCAIESAAAEMVKQRDVDKWFSGADDKVMQVRLLVLLRLVPVLQSALQVSNGVNGPLLEMLAKEAGHHDCIAVNQFRHGADLIGVLTCAGNGRPVPAYNPTPISVLQESRAEANGRIVNSGRIDRCVRGNVTASRCCTYFLCQAC